jgi:hypothetical protein
VKQIHLTGLNILSHLANSLILIVSNENSLFPTRPSFPVRQSDVQLTGIGVRIVNVIEE